MENKKRVNDALYAFEAWCKYVRTGECGFSDPATLVVNLIDQTDTIMRALHRLSEADETDVITLSLGDTKTILRILSSLSEKTKCGIINKSHARYIEEILTILNAQEV